MSAIIMKGKEPNRLLEAWNLLFLCEGIHVSVFYRTEIRLDLAEQQHSKAFKIQHREHAGPFGRVLVAFQHAFEHQKHPGQGLLGVSGGLRVRAHRPG